MKRIGLVVYLLSNLYLAGNYSYEIIRLINGTYNYDGWRYLLLISLTDIAFSISLIIILLKLRLSFLLLTALVILQNIACFCFGVTLIPFAGIFVSLISILAASRILLRTIRATDQGLM